MAQSLANVCLVCIQNALLDSSGVKNALYTIYKLLIAIASITS